MYHGAVVPGRGIEKCLEVLKYDEELYLVILGDALSVAYKEKLKKVSVELGVDNRILFTSSVPAEELWKYIGAADNSMVLIEPVVRSYYYALPNKLFEGIQAGTPVIGSDLPEIRRIVKKYDIGEVCRYEETKDIYRAVESIKCSDERKKKIRKNEEKAAEILCWEVESKRLKAAYRKIW